MRSSLFCAVEAVLAAFLLCGCGQSRQNPSPGAENSALAELDAEGLAPEVRKRVEQAYRGIGENPADASMPGRLGMLLHAYGRYDAAERYYRKAEELDPASFRWIYLRGLVLAEQGRTRDAASTDTVAPSSESRSPLTVAARSTVSWG